MKLKTFLRKLTPEQRQTLAAAVGSKPIYLYRIGKGCDPLPSVKLAGKIARASGGKVNLSQEYPEVFGGVA